MGTDSNRKRSKTPLLGHIEQIVTLSQGSQLSVGFYKKAARHIKPVSEALSMTREQVVMLAMFVDGSAESMYLSKFAEHFGCRMIRLFSYIKDVDELERRGYVRCRRSDRTRVYSMPLEVIDALKDGVPYKPEDHSNLNAPQLLDVIAGLFERISDEEMTPEMLRTQIKELLLINNTLPFVTKVQAYTGSDDEEMILLLLFCHLYAHNMDNNIIENDLRYAFDRHEWRYIYSKMQEGGTDIQTAGLIEYNSEDGMADVTSYRMSEKGKSELLADFNLREHRRSRHNELIDAAGIAAKSLYYSENVGHQIDELAMLLDRDKYAEVKRRLNESGLRSGFTCLFYGAPGTGKTETVLQLARTTGRSIMQVNIAAIKSMWVGESEKNIKRLFDRYRMIVSETALTPILLFNEADAIIGARNEHADRAVEKMENTLQNIILQEMETLDGILIATTNLVSNMDKAFERRFLYKVRFEKPDVSARVKIWQTMLPGVSVDILSLLANEYTFSGGQIENIARHYAIDRVLHGDNVDTLSMLRNHCEGERLDGNNIVRVGF